MAYPSSRLLLLPLELRVDIYHLVVPSHLHVQLQAARIALFPCLGSDESSNDGHTNHFEGDGFEMLLDYPTSVIGRATTRPHWRCEAGTLSDGAEKKSWLKVFAVCKQIRDEAVDLMQRTATFHLSDLDVLRHFSEHAADSATKPNLAAWVFQRTSRIAISPIFSPAIYRSLEQTDDAATPCPETNVITKSWRVIGSHLAALPNLAQVMLWLDHDEPFRWALNNERALLSPLADSICGDDLEFHVSLPNLHPDHEDVDKHFTGRVHTPFTLSRRPRQWYDRGESFNDVDIRARQRNLPDSLEMFQVLAGLLGSAMLRSELERNEHEYWKAGTDWKDITAEIRVLSEWTANSIGLNILREGFGLA